MTVRGLASSQVSRLKALQEKHSAISARIQQEQHHPSAMDFYLRQLKKQRLYLKDEIEGVRSSAAASGWD